jgi:threonine dehydrogenase-like Zn-dependent dehydrogenase
LFGRFPGPSSVDIDFNLIHHDEIELLGSYWVGVEANANIGLFRYALSLIEERKVPVEELITSVYPLEKIDEAFLAARRKDGFKVIVKP